MQEINLNGLSLDIVKENVIKLKQLFPEIVTEDNIDFDKLKAVLGEYVEKDDESYRFTWHGKRDAFRKSQITSTGTLRPCIEESKDWDTTQNLYIEGDNLEVLKLLQKSYDNSIKMIYIDPPYNKDKDFVYPDKWSDPIKEYKKITGQLDEDGNITSSDTEDEGGRHTKWLNMMYSRLRIARKLLSDDGVIYISIDDEEVANLKKLCDEVFGEENYIDCAIVKKSTNGMGDKKGFAKNHEYILVYQKSELSNFIGLTPTEEYINSFNKTDKHGKYKVDGILMKKGQGSRREDSPTLFFPIYYNPETGEVYYESKGNYIEKYPIKSDGSEGRWTWGKDTIKEDYWRLYASSGGTIYIKDYFKPDRRMKITSILDDVAYITDRATNEIKDLFGKKVFDTPKPLTLIEHLIDMANLKENDILLDFFSGSSTSAHAIVSLNAKTNKNCRFIMVQFPESLDKTIEMTDKSSKNNIKETIDFLDSINRPHFLTEIGKERIRRGGESIKAELKKKYDIYQQKQQSILEGKAQPPMNPDDLDIGFKVFKLDNSNLKKWSVDVGEDFYKESKDVQNVILSEMLGIEVDNFVEGRSELDVVYEIMLKYGLDLAYPIETYNFDGTNIYSIGYGGLIVCLDTNIKAELADRIVALIRELEPSMVRVAVRDLSFKSDSAKTNFKETLKNGVYAYFDSSEDKANKQNQFKFITI